MPPEAVHIKNESVQPKMLASNATGSIRAIREIRVRQWQFRRSRSDPTERSE